MSHSTTKVSNGDARTENLKPRDKDDKDDDDDKRLKSNKNPWIELEVTEQSVGEDKADDIPLDLDKYESLYDKPDGKKDSDKVSYGNDDRSSPV